LREEIAEVILGRSVGKSLENMPEVPVWLDFVCLGGLDQRVKSGTGIGPLGASGEQPIPPEQVRSAFARWIRVEDLVQVTEGPAPR